MELNLEDSTEGVRAFAGQSNKLPKIQVESYKAQKANLKKVARKYGKNAEKQH